jgi:PAS domain S-box-containing protein
MREYVRRLLSGRYEVVAVADGEAALEAARRRPFDLVLTDVMMPRLDGFGLLKALRADERTATTPVILLSAREGEESRVEGIEAGADDYLVKPFSARELIARVEGRLDLQRMRREAQSALRESEARLSAVLQQLPVGLCVTDRNGRLTMSNAIMRAFVAENIPSRDPRQMGRWRAFDEAGNPIPPDEWPGARALRGQTVSPGMEMSYTADDGREIWTRASSAPLRDGAGEIIGAIAVIEDVDERKRAEEALRESEGRFRNMADNAPVMIWVTEPDAGRAYLNKSWYEFTGQTPETALGSGWLDATHPDDRERAERTFLAANAEREAFRLEYRLRRKDGEYRWAIDAASPRFGQGGEFLGHIGSVIDITERKQMEGERERLLAEEQAAREIAEQATRAKDEFLAVVSHELRSPLNAILGWNNLLDLKYGDDPQIAKVTETIERSGRSQLQLIEDLLDTTRIIAGKLRLESLPVELADVISSALETVRPAAGNKGIAVTTSIDPKAGQITGDPDRLQQVVWNLVSNAIKFTPEGGRVWVELRRGDAGVQIVVSDTGHGIATDLLPYVFDRFKQGDSSSARRFGGLGLGLALAKHLVELHGGSVAVESPGEGLGATFTVNLPIRAVRGDSGTEGRREGKAAPDQFARRRQRAPGLEGMRALVVDDEAGARELLAATLELHSVLVTGADSTDAALAEIESRLGDSEAAPFDVLISDIGMPGADGYELIRRVRAHPDERVSRLRAVALTAYARSEDRLRALRAGFYMHVPKPVDEEELTTVIAALMGGPFR